MDLEGPSGDALDPGLPGIRRPLGQPVPVAPGGFIAEEAAPEDRAFMARALEQAKCAALLGEVPVGAVLVRDHRIVAEGHNRTRTRSDPTAHAEVDVLRLASRRQGDWRLDGTTLYVTLEPCAQCAGSLVLSRVDRLVWGAPDPKAGMAGSLGNLVQDRRLNHRIRMTTGVLGEASGELLRSFFRSRR